MSVSSNDAEVIVIGYGNSQRRDDGAGIVLAEHISRTLAAAEVSAHQITATQLTPEMAEELAAPSVKAVVFIDVTLEQEQQGISLRSVDVDSASASTGHHLSPATVLLYAALLYGKRLRAWLIAVPGQDFAHGTGFSPQLQQLLRDTQTIEQQLLDALKEASICMS